MSDTINNVDNQENLTRVKLGSHGLPTTFGGISSNNPASSSTRSTLGNNDTELTNMDEENKQYVPAQLDVDYGAWQKYTSGFGMKMLSKMGFRERLGKFEQGIANPIRRAPIRKGTEGLGARKGGEQTWDQPKTAQQELEEMKQKIQEHRRLEEEKEKKLDKMLDNL